jgi:hypothetical protein
MMPSAPCFASRLRHAEISPSYRLATESEVSVGLRCHRLACVAAAAIEGPWALLGWYIKERFHPGDVTNPEVLVIICNIFGLDEIYGLEQSAHRLGWH